MTVEPGYGGQTFMDNQLAKIAEIRRRLAPHQRLAVDGGITLATIGPCAQAGADVYIAGTSIFRASDPAAAVGELRRAAEGGGE